TVNTELQANMENLANTNNDLNNLFSSTNIATIFLDRNLCIKRFTPAATKVMNFIDADIGRPFVDISSNLQYQGLVDDARKVLKTLVFQEKEVQDTKGRHYFTRILPYRTQDNVIDGVVITLVDITIQKEAEEAVSRARDYSEGIIETVRESLVVLDHKLRVVSANNSFYKTFRVVKKDTEGKLIYELGNKQWNIPALKRLLEKLLPKNKVLENFEVEHTFEHIGHKVMSLNARRIVSCGAKNQFILLAIDDITMRKEFENKLKQAARFPAENPNPVMRIANDGTLLYANKSCLRCLKEYQCVVGKFAGNIWKDFVDEALLLKRPRTKELKCGSKIFLFFIVPRSVSQDLNVYGMDVTMQKKAEDVLKRDKIVLQKIVKDKSKELLDAQKRSDQERRLSDIGLLAATVAHEIRNPLAAIKAAIFNVKCKRKTTAIDKHIANVDKKIDEASQIVNNLLSYSRTKVPEYQNINIYNLIKNEAHLVKDMFPKASCSIVRSFEKLKDCVVEADPFQIAQVLKNIIINAIQATEDKKGIIKITGKRINKKMVEIVVKDNGIGIDSKDLKKTYSPFFTTKTKGTGLGLSVCKKIVDLHNGSIQILSKKGRGTEVILKVPIKR
ncbi:MAG: PAS domain-containing protein, partial [Candidatus Omnitrophota bacterium]